MHAKYCMAIMVPMMQLSQSVVWMRSSSWIIHRVLATDWAKQQNTWESRGTHKRQVDRLKMSLRSQQGNTFKKV
jgi:hypothetical protein